MRLRTIPVCAFTLFLLPAPAMYGSRPKQAGIGTGQPSPAPQSTAGEQTTKDLPNFSEVTPRLYRGAQPTNAGFEGLAKMGVNIVVDLRGSRDTERALVTKLGMQYVAIPWHCYSPKDELFARFLTLLRENPGKKVFVHCRLGDDRTGMMIAAYRMAQQGWSAEDAMKDMEAHGFSYAHHWICPGLGAYEQQFPQRFKTSPVFQSLRDKASATPQN